MSDLNSFAKAENVGGGSGLGNNVDYAAMAEDLKKMKECISAIVTALEKKPDVSAINIDGQTLQPQVDKVMNDLKTVIPDLESLSKDVTEVQARYAANAASAKNIMGA